MKSQLDKKNTSQSSFEAANALMDEVYVVFTARRSHNATVRWRCDSFAFDCIKQADKLMMKEDGNEGMQKNIQKP